MVDALSVEPRGTDAYDIRYVHRDPVKAALVPNRLARRLVEEAKSDETGPPDPAVLEARLVSARKVVDREGSRTPSPSGGEHRRRTRRFGTVGTSFEADRRAITLALAAARARADALQVAIEAESRPAPVDRAASAELEALRAQRDELRQRYTEEHPDVEALTRRIRRLEAAPPPAPDPAPSARLEPLRAQLVAVEAEIEDLVRKEAALGVGTRGAAAGPRPRADSSASRRQPDLVTLTRELEQAQADVRTLEEEWRAAETASRLGRGARARFEILQPAAVPAEPYFPNRLTLCPRGPGARLRVGAGVGSRGRVP